MGITTTYVHITEDDEMRARHIGESGSGRMTSVIFVGSHLTLILPKDPAAALQAAENLHGATMKLLEETERWVASLQEQADRS